jgi:hypothetical protein
MATNYNPRISIDGLLACFDAANTKSYPGTGTTWTDLIQSIPMTIYGAVTHQNGYFTFGVNQTTQYIMNTSFPMPTGDHTVESWFRITNNQANQTPYTYSVAGDNALLLFTNSLTQVAPHSFGNSFGINVPNMLNRWINFTRTRIQSIGVEVYCMDGVQIGTRTYSAGTAHTTNGYLIIGQEADSPGGGFDANQNLDGDFSFISVYNRALSAAEIQQNFNALRGRYGV